MKLVDNAVQVCYHLPEQTMKKRIPAHIGTLSLDQLLSGLGPALFSSIRTPFGIFDKDRRIVWINKSMAFVHKCDQNEAIGKLCHEALRGCENFYDDCPLVNALETGSTQVVEKWIDLPGGERRWGEVQAYPVRDQNKNISAVIIIVFETTASKRALQKQKSYSELLEQELHSKESGPKKVSLNNDDIFLSVKLSRREIDVLRLVTEGYTNVQIAEVLDISANTVKTHINSLFNKLGVNDRTQAAVLAARNHLL
jgi:DNA-binding CsgD family transcriptional regulator